MQMIPRLSPRDESAHDALRDQLVALVPPSVRITAQGWRPWASASFAGARHWFDLAVGDTPAAALHAMAVAEREWPLPGAFVADAALHEAEPQAGQWRVELLVVDD